MCGIFGADNQIRTGDLILTKDVLYQLSHISKSSCFEEEHPCCCKGVGADNQIRTGDLILTKDVLYQLSHISKP